MEIQHVYTKKRSEFGRQCIFSDRAAEIVLDIAPNPADLNNYIERSPCEIGIQCAKEMSEHYVNTERSEFTVKGINHVEGGWPKDINYAEPEQVARFRKKVEKEEMYVSQVLTLGEKMEQCIKQNNAIDIYEDYFDNMKTKLDEPQVAPVQVPTDGSETKDDQKHDEKHDFKYFKNRLYFHQKHKPGQRANPERTPRPKQIQTNSKSCNGV